MTSEHKDSHPRRIAHIKYAILTGVLVCAANYGLDFVLNLFKVTASQTILNDLAIGLLAALAVFFFLSASHQKQSFDQAKQRMILLAELNAHIRRTFGEFAESALSEDRVMRLRSIDDASERIDVILSEINVGR